jgi:hypothetical protein
VQEDIEQEDIEPKISKRFRPTSRYPALAVITIDPADWYRFERLVGDTPATKIIGHDDPEDGLMKIFVACASDKVRDRLEKGWA